jgi:hypothetical protein
MGRRGATQAALSVARHSGRRLVSDGRDRCTEEPPRLRDPSRIGGGTDAGDTVTPFVDRNEAYFFPLGTPNLFKTFFARADYIETINTLGLPRYAKAIPSDNNKSVRLEMQTNPLSLCLRPRALIKGLHH